MQKTVESSKIPSELWRYFEEFTTASMMVCFDMDGNLQVYSYLPQTKDMFAMTQAIGQLYEQMVDSFDAACPSEDEIENSDD